MTGVVTASFPIGGKAIESKQDRDELCRILGIKDSTRDRLPLGPACIYRLTLATNKEIPKTCETDEEAAEKAQSGKG